jgi:WD40 repeat protein
MDSCDADVKTVFEGHTREVNSICFLNDLVFTCSNDKTVRSWNVNTGQQLHVFEGHTSDLFVK